MSLKRGKKPAVYDPRGLLYHNYKTAAAPLYPATATVPNGVNWGMLGNDTAGDCVWAGADHEVELWNHNAGKRIQFSTQDTLSDYSAVTGYNPSDPNSDQGTDVLTALKYRRKTGTIDSTGKRHKLGAYVAIENGNVAHVKQAVWDFDAVGIGFAFPDSAMDQFNAGKPWTVVAGAPTPTDGHYVCGVGYDTQWVYVVTWAKVQRMSWGFYTKYADETYALLSPEFLKGGKSPAGFDMAQLTADLKLVGK